MALHRLCHWLNVLGHTAGVSTAGLNPEWEAQTWDGNTHETIAVYPEIIPGNPLNCPRVVRWALCDPGHQNCGHPCYGMELFDECDLAFYFAPFFYEATKLAWNGREPQRLTVSVWPSDMFYSWDGARPVDAYYIGRGTDTFAAHADKVDLTNALELQGDYPNRYVLAKALRRIRKLYMFAQVSSLIPEAMLCGCEVLLVTPKGEVVQCQPNGPECLGVFDPKIRFDEAGDVRGFIEACQCTFS